MLPRRIAAASLLGTLLCIPRLDSQSPAVARVEAIRFWSFGDVTRVAIQTAGSYKLVSDQIENPWRVYFDLTGLNPPPTVHHGIDTIQVADHRVKQIRVAEVSPGKTRIVFDLESPADVVSSQLVNPDRLMIEVRPKGAAPAISSYTHSITGSQRIDLSKPDSNPASAANVSAIAAAVTPPVPDGPPADSKPTKSGGVGAPAPSSKSSTPPASPTTGNPNPPVAKLPPITVLTPGATAHEPAESASETPLTNTRELAAAPAVRDSTGQRSLVRVFGLKLGRVVIDAGHGGHDTGTIGPNGLMEKDLVLDVALRLGKLITQQLGAEVRYTRSGDIFIPLEERTRIANEDKADLFISIHANSSPEASATGVETYYFNLTSDKSGLDLATRENAASASSISDLGDLLHKAVLQTKLEESREFAQKIQASLWASSVRMNSRSRDRGVRQAPFVVLIGATMPSILAEIGFVSNPHDERLLRRSDQRQKIAEALYKGISGYASSLSHLQIARTKSE
jgi:N-acetylmuramoyl-L-alanine amidase